ncbi:hypothetical protein P4594_25260, partial [Priestia megaterium]|uniref:hypothetical protein n=1 Tax=Priestia megaterium TaxID=1404 RepID=UPI002E1FAE74|nr:hypothetical protein [Priestia megaterium]
GVNNMSENHNQNGEEREIVQKALENFQKYLELKDTILNNKYIELFSEVSKAVSFVRGVNDLITRKKFQRFLEGFGEDIQPTEAKIKKLVKYVNNEKRAEFISNTFTKVVLSNSSKSCVLMGSILHSIVSEDGPLEHKKLICINALTTFFDNDLDNFYSLSQYLKFKNTDSKRKFKSISLPTMKDYCKKENLDFESISITAEKCVSSQIMSKYYIPDISATMDREAESIDIDNIDMDEFYQITNSGELLLQYMDKIVE